MTRRALLSSALLSLALSCLDGADPRFAAGHGDPRHEREATEPMPMLVLPGGAKRLYLANDDHTDYLWSGNAAQYRSAFLAMLDYYMTQAETTAHYPADARGRFNADGSLWVREYEAVRSPAEFQRLLGHLRAGTITMPLNTVVPVYGAMPAEAVLRDMYWAGRLERREDLRFPLVVPMENQTLPGGVASLWAGSGARYAWKGICDCNTQIDAADRPREAYHFTGPDGASVLMKWNSAPFGNQSIGGYAEARNPHAAVNLLDSNPAYLSNWPWDVSGAFGYGWDDFSSFTDDFIEASLEHSVSSRRVIVSNEIDFFQDFENTYGPLIGSFGGAFGNEWDLLTASLGAVTSGFKRDLERLRTAEALAAVASVFDTGFASGLASSRDSAFMACGLYYEHNWSAHGDVGPAEREDWQRGIARSLRDYVETLHRDGLARLGAMVPAGGAERHVVFNPLSWSRTDAVDLDAVTPEPRHVVDAATGIEVASQSVTVGGQPRLRILAADVPSVGYRVYEVRPDAGAVFPPSASVTLPTVVHESYRVTLGARGQLQSVQDRKNGDRELVEAGQAIHDLGSGNGTVTLETSGPVSTTLRVISPGSPDHETRVTLIAGVDRIDVEGVVTENFGSSTVGWTSRFALPGAVMRHEEVGMIARVGRAAAGGDYAASNTRTDWLTFNHFVDLSQPSYGVTLSNLDSPFFRAGNSTITILDGTTPMVRAVVGMQVQGSSRGIPDQGGDARFEQRYALRTHGAWDAGLAMRFALEHQNPLVATAATGTGVTPLGADTWSLLSLGPSDVVLWALKPAEEGEGRGLIARVWNVADGPRAIALGLPGTGLASAMRTTHIETDLGPADVQGELLNGALARQQFATYRLFPAATAHVGRPPGVRLGLALYPNPGGAGVARRIDFTLSRAARVRATVYDLRGAQVATPVDAAFEPGRHSASWDGRDARGALPAPGVYFLRVEADGREETARLVVID